MPDFAPKCGLPVAGTVDETIKLPTRAANAFVKVLIIGPTSMHVVTRHFGSILGLIRGAPGKPRSQMVCGGG